MDERIYIAIDLKSFYASVECVARGLDPLTTNLVVADPTRTSKTICLAVSPSLKAFGISGRARLFEAEQRVREVNIERAKLIPGGEFSGSSTDSRTLELQPSLKIDFITAPPRMREYMNISARIFDIYLRYVAAEDMHVYSVDEVFMDVTHYLSTFKLTPYEMANRMIHDVLRETGITATAGIGTNMYLCKVAMDVWAKHMKPDEDGVRIAFLDEETYKKNLWSHKPITDFWRVGAGTAKKLAQYGMETMGDVARCSIGDPAGLYNEDLLFRLFGVNAELLIDHAWGYEPCTIAHIKKYKPQSNSLSIGQVLKSPYEHDKTRLIVKEMADLLVLDLVDKRVTTNQIVLTIGYDIENLSKPEIRDRYKGEVTYDRYGRGVPKHSHGTANLGHFSSSTREIVPKVVELFDRIANPLLLSRRINIAACNLAPEEVLESELRPEYEQLDLFTDYEALERERQAKALEIKKENRLQHAVLDIKKKYGKNALLKGMNLEEGGTTIERNGQVGGHKA